MDEGCRERIERVLSSAETSGRKQLLEAEVYMILREVGIQTPRFEVLPLRGSDADWMSAVIRLTTDPAPKGFVIKIQSPEILHKTEAGGIAFAPPEGEMVVRESRQLLNRVRENVPTAHLNGLLLTEKISHEGNIPGKELLLSLRQDPALGPVVVLGLGGLLTEWYGKLAPGETTWIISAHDLIFNSDTPPDFAGHSPAFSLLFGPSRLHGGKPPIDPNHFWKLLKRWKDLAATFGIDGESNRYVLEEIEINPLVVIEGESLIALDGVGRFCTTKLKATRRPVGKIKNLLSPRSAAVIGASAKAQNPGRIILQNLKAAEGLSYGHLYPIHPSEDSIDTIPCVPSVKELPEKVDLAVVSVPAQPARDVIGELIDEQKTESIILIPGGFAETGDTNLAAEIIESLENSRSLPDGGPVLVGGNCLGIVSKKQYNTFFLPEYKLPFHEARGDNLAAISQSGAYLVTLTSNLDGVIFPKASISYGNQMDLTVSDFLEHYLDDDEVQVIACYVEGFQPLDGLRFIELACEHRRRGRTVIVLKAGKTALGAKAAASHTASLAGDYAVARSLMKNSGVIVAETLNSFEDYTKVFTMLYDRIPTGVRAGVISNAGFEASNAMDALYDLELATLAESTKVELEACLPKIAHADNPIDATPMATTGHFVCAVEVLLRDPNVDGVVVSPLPPTQALDTMPPDLTGSHLENIYALTALPPELIRVFRNTKKPFVACVDSGRLYDDFVVLLQRAGIPTFRKIDRATRALSLYCSRRVEVSTCDKMVGEGVPPLGG